MKRLIIYDLDGTLVDTREDIAHAVNHMLKEMAHKPLPQATIEKHVGRGLHHLVANCLGTRDSKPVEKGARLYRQYYAEHMMDHTQLYPGALDMLNYFKDRLQAVITNKPNPFTEQMLKALGVAKYFSDIVAGDTDFPKKPDPSAVLFILQREKIKSDEALFIGDSLVDIETGRNAGIETVVTCHGFTCEEELQSANPHAVVRDFKELLELIKKKGW